MLEFLAANLATILISLALAVVVALIIGFAVRRRRKGEGPSCAGGCSGCAGACGCNPAQGHSGGQ